MVSPTIVNGSRSSQIMGRKKMNTRAKGQHNESKINQRRIARSVFINCILKLHNKLLAKINL